MTLPVLPSGLVTAGGGTRGTARSLGTNREQQLQPTFPTAGGLEGALQESEEGSRQAEPGRGQSQRQGDRRKRCAFGRGFHTQTQAGETQEGLESLGGSSAGLAPVSPDPAVPPALGVTVTAGTAPAPRPPAASPLLLTTVDVSPAGEAKDSDTPLAPAAAPAGTEEPREVQEGREMPGKQVGEFTLPGFQDAAASRAL